MYVTPSSTSGTVPPGMNRETSSGLTAQCRNVTSRHHWPTAANRTGRGVRGVTGSVMHLKVPLSGRVLLGETRPQRRGATKRSMETALKHPVDEVLPPARLG